MTKEIIRSRATDAQIKAIKAGPAERLVNDEGAANLYLVVSPLGKKSWRWQSTLKVTATRTKAVTRKMGIGPFPAYSLSMARERAEEFTTMRARGVDPKEEVARVAATTIAETNRTAALTVEAVFDAWIKEKRRVGKAAKSLHEYQRLGRANLVLPYGTRPIGLLTKQDIRASIAAMEERGARVSGNRFLRVIQSFLDWATHEDFVNENVAAKIGFVDEGARSQRFLSVDELALLYRASAQLDDDERDAIRLLILTGTRAMEAMGARSSDLDEGGVWTLPVAAYTDDRGHTFPVSHAKFAREHHMLLSPLALSIFKSRADRPFLFHKTPHKNMMPDITKNAGAAMLVLGGKPVEHWTLHKIRKGVRSALSSDQMDEMLEREGNGQVFSENIGEIATNHSLGTLNKTYNKSQYGRAVGRALAAWERLLRETIARQTGENVIPLAAAA